MLVAIGTIASQQSKSTQATRYATVWLLNYAASHPNSTIRYNASDMVLHLHSDAYYLSEPGACRRVGGHYLFGYKSTDPTKPPLTDFPLNGPIHTVSKILLKPKSVQLFTMAKMTCRYELPSRNSGTRNHELQSASTTLPQKVSQTAP